MERNPQIFEPRYPTRNTGYFFVVLTLVLSLVTLIFVFNIFVNDYSRNDPDYGQFNLVALALSVLVGISLLIASLWAVRKFLRNQPTRVILNPIDFNVEDVASKSQIIIRYEDIQSLEEARQKLAEGQYEASFKQMYISYATSFNTANSIQELQDIILNERDTSNFDELMDALWELAPVEARGPRTFER